ncbi:DENN domain-containing protein 1C isoform X2 [Ochotona curzoniae]|uniref:DENN domain-containing protein 1C isoform X2 n=1 Tax=Ochotona curzoniae TaxID=130825 RepID=UPI001B34A5CD|nr:DENN domain-containing protein 1C isoform X2 [Ochotona curzoniae]
MGSKAEGSPPAVFDWFFEAACPASLQSDPPILWQFPPDFRDQEAVQMVPKFCFPFDVEREPPSPAAQHFTFALTDLAGNRRFGFCRLRAGAQSCLCILSHLPWFEVFYKLLNTVGDLLAQDQVSEAEDLLQNMQQQTLPGNRGSAGLGLLSCFVAPKADRLPSIPENRNLTELVVAVRDENILGLFAALLAERRVLLVSSKLSTLTSCVHASCALLYPMRWEHVLIPTLPPHLLDYCSAPMPYLIGVHASLMERVRDRGLEDVVVMDVDANTLETPFDDIGALPPDVVSLLRLRLRKAALSPGEGVSRLFLHAQALLFGGYRDALVCSPGQPITFSEEAFLGQKPGAPLQAFHRRAVHLQLFKQFIEGRLEKLNSGESFGDPFEEQITCCGSSSGGIRSYQLWADSLKKGGGALLNSVKTKTQPAVRNMYRSAKSSLKGMQHLLYKEGDPILQRGGSLRVPAPTSRSDRLQQRLPITQHFGQVELPVPPRPPLPDVAPSRGPCLPLPGLPHLFPSPKQNRPPRPSKRHRPEERPPEISTEGTLSSLSPEEQPSPWAEDTLDNSFLGSGEELDLLTEILGSLSVGTDSMGGLRPSQSLDCCHCGDLDGNFNLPDTPASGRWASDHGDPAQPLSLSVHLSPPPVQAVCPSGTPCPQLPMETHQDMAPAPPSSQGDPRPPDLTESLILRLSPPQEAAEDGGAWATAVAPTQHGPQLPTPGTSVQPCNPSLDSGCPDNPRAPLPKLPLEPTHPQHPPPELRGASTAAAAPIKNRQEPQVRSQSRVADLKKCFES